MLVALLVVMALAAPVFAQAELPPGQVEVCRQLGIEPEKCTERAILGKRCLGINCQHQPTDLKIDPVVLSILVGCVVAFAAGVIYVKRTANEKSNQKPQ
ncbi:MAG: hypothetical protein ACREAY_06130 [Nitrososphaera sp.]|uniref:hypothetical protein n=1 Tax=Nitrososphaera sp. TaxID=1971748 RepID=UPI003D7008BB